MPNKRYVLEMDAEQFKVLLPALDLAFRLHLGQLGMVNEFLSSEVKTPNNVPFFDDEVTTYLKAIKQIYFGHPQLSSGPGIYNPEISDRARMLVDIHDVIRNKIAWDEHTSGQPTIYVQYDAPRQHSKFGLPTLKDVETSNGGPKFVHGCADCRFVATVTTRAGLVADLYVNCSPRDGAEYVLRYSSDPSDYAIVDSRDLSDMF